MLLTRGNWVSTTMAHTDILIYLLLQSTVFLLMSDMGVNNIEIGTQVELTETEIRLSKHIAKSRSSGNRSEGVTNAKMGKISDEKMDLEGAASEIAFCKLFNIFPDLTISTRSSKAGTDSGGDCTLANGLTVDVKTTTRERGRLLAPKWKKAGSVHLYALLVGSCPTYTFKGFIQDSDLLKEENLIDLGYGITYAVTQDKLKMLQDALT